MSAATKLTDSEQVVVAELKVILRSQADRHPSAIADMLSAHVLLAASSGLIDDSSATLMRLVVIAIGDVSDS